MLYESLRVHGSSPINSISTAENESLTDTEDLIIKSIYEKYGHLGAFALSNLSHISGGPWDKAWNTCRFSEIENSSIQAFYGSR